MTIVSKSSAFPKTVQAGRPKLGDRPAGWIRAPLRKFLHEERRPVKLDENQEYRLVTVKRARGGVVERERLLGRDIAVKSQFRVHAGDFLISKRQIVHGACGLVPKDLDGAIVSNEYAVLRGNPQINLEFLNNLAHTIYFQQTCFHSSIGVHIEKMIFKLERWLDWEFDLPPLSEQIRIAAILSTWDRAIGTTNDLILNCEGQNKALTNLLLSGKKRLRRFQTQRWTTEILGQLGAAYGGLTGKSKANFGSGKPYVPYTNVFQNSSVDMSDLELVQIGDDENQNRVQFGDIIFTTSSETPEEVGMSSVILAEPGEAYLNSFCFGFRLHNFKILRPEFARFLFRGEQMRREISKLAQGSTRYNLSKTRFLNLSCDLPKPDEQLAIAEILKSAEECQKNLSSQRRCLLAQRSALMQQLLSGKRRVEMEVAA